MKRKLVIFGTGDIAQLASVYFTLDSDYEVSAFCVDSQFRQADMFEDKPVVDFENVVDHYPPEEFQMFIALSYTKLNELRKTKYLAAKAMGYKFASYVSSAATIVGHAKIGENCFILEDNTIQPFVKIGDNTTLWSGNHIGHHSEIDDHVFLASHIVISGGVKIGAQSFIGVNATLRDHITIGEKCVVGAGALMLADAEENGVYLANATERSRVPASRLRKI